jgi:hypothetical protein
LLICNNLIIFAPAKRIVKKIYWRDSSVGPEKQQIKDLRCFSRILENLKPLPAARFSGLERMIRMFFKSDLILAR